ncbi:hypothetical protein Tco_1452653, partial [Tanacetum coccineum]
GDISSGDEYYLDKVLNVLTKNMFVVLRKLSDWKIAMAMTFRPGYDPVQAAQLHRAQ